MEDLVGTSDYRIDLAVIHPNNPNEYILGIECDGGAYQRAKSARDRDRTRTSVMEGLGWNIFHVWAPSYFENKTKIIKKIQKVIKELIKP